ncbi:MAG: hypothetical protein ACYC0V_10590 [Armatimonadota bacterium]
MKQNVPPGVAILVIAIMAVIIALAYMKFASPGARAVELEKAIQATVIKAPPGWKPGQTLPMGGPSGMSPDKKPIPASPIKK